MNLTFAANLTKMIDAGLGREAAPPETFVAVGRTTEYSDQGPVPIASFETNAEAPLRALSVSMEPIQAGTGDPSPENVRAITGRSAVIVMRTGVNVWDEDWEVGDINTSGINAPSSLNIRSKGYISVSPSTSYYLYVGSNVNMRYFYYDADKTLIQWGDANNVVRTTPGNCRYVRFKMIQAYGTAYNNDISINYPATDHDYHPGTVQTVTLQLGQTVYGGTLDVVSGVLTVNWELVNLGDLTWSLLSDSVGPYFRTAATRVLRIPSGVSSMICSNYPTVSSGNVVDKSIARSTGSTDYIYLRDTTYETVEAFTAAMDGVMLAYPVKNEFIQTVQLTPEQITTLIGQNNVWSDGGDVSLTYGTTRYTEGY